MIEDTLKHQLRALIGCQVKYAGRDCWVIEVLDSEQALVVQYVSKNTTPAIQGNQFGGANRRVEACHTLQLFNDAQELDGNIVRWLHQASL